MLLILKVFLIVALIKLLLATDNPLLCAGIYGGFCFLFGLLWGHPLAGTAVSSAIAFGLAFGYFWLLDKFTESGFFWLIMVLGILIGLV